MIKLTELINEILSNPEVYAKILSLRAQFLTVPDLYLPFDYLMRGHYGSHIYTCDIGLQEVACAMHSREQDIEYGEKWERWLQWLEWAEEFKKSNLKKFIQLLNTKGVPPKTWSEYLTDKAWSVGKWTLICTGCFVVFAFIMFVFYHGGYPPPPPGRKK